MQKPSQPDNHSTRRIYTQYSSMHYCVWNLYPLLCWLAYCRINMPLWFNQFILLTHCHWELRVCCVHLPLCVSLSLLPLLYPSVQYRRTWIAEACWVWMDLNATFQELVSGWRGSKGKKNNRVIMASYHCAVCFFSKRSRRLCLTWHYMGRHRLDKCSMWRMLRWWYLEWNKLLKGMWSTA